MDVLGIETDELAKTGQWMASSAPASSAIGSTGGIPGLVQLEIEQVEHRFPPPGSVDELEACFVVKDSSGQKLAYVYYEEEPGRRSAAKPLTKDEARRIAVTIAKLPELLSDR